MEFPDSIDKVSRSITTAEYGNAPHRVRHIIKIKDKYRTLSVTEIERLQGFPDSWSDSVSEKERYKTLGNAVTPNVVTALLNEMFRNTEYERENGEINNG